MLPAFLVYIDDLKTFKGVIPKEDFSDALWAVAEYTETGEEPTGLSPMATVLFRTIKAKVDRESEKYERKCEAGAKGGRPKTQTNQAKPTETNGNQEKPTETNGNQKNQKEIETETEKETEIYTTTGGTRAREEETPFGTVTIDPLIVKVQREIVGMTDTHYDLFRQYRDDLGDELVSYAIDSAVAQGVRKWAYLETILCRYETARYKTVAEVKAAEEERKTRAAPQKPLKTVTAQRFTQREYTDEQLDGEMSPLLANALRKVQEEDEGITGNVV
jgi:DnaD/phage-associated family protein